MSARWGSALSRRVSVSPSMPGSCTSIRMSAGWNSSSTRSASSASIAVRTVYPSPRRSTRASFRFCGLSSTMRMGSPGILRLLGQRGKNLAQHLDERRGAGALRDDLAHVREREQPCMLGGAHVADRPHHDGDVFEAGNRVDLLDEPSAALVRQEEIDDERGGPMELRELQTHLRRRGPGRLRVELSDG